ncbi:uridine kinase [Candidatus Gracilibacteria bacterium 28_42_T64]|nr:uridine kinase [Candidatus Gracilibacteria bacterium 28_42_T64]
MQDKNYSLYDGLFHVKKIIKKRLEFDPNIFIFVTGGSASGKTSRVANNIQKFFKEESIVLSMDNYFKGKEYFQKHNITFDEPEAIDIDLLVSHLELLKDGNIVYIPGYDFNKGVSIPESIKVEPKRIIIIEGLFTLDDRFEEVSDLNIFVETAVNGRLIRRVLRDVKRTKQKVNQIVDIFVEVVHPMHMKHIEPQKKNADVIILNEFIPYLEVKGLDIEKFINENNIPTLS